MPKKYYQNPHDRRDESRGMRKYEKSKGGKMSHRYGDEHNYSMDSGYMGMISEDHSAPSNLPQHIKHDYYPTSEYLDSYYLDDTYRGIDDTLDDTIRTIDHHQSDSMY